MPHCVFSIDIGYKNLGYTIIELPEQLENILPKSSERGSLNLSESPIFFDIFNITEQHKNKDVVSSRCLAIEELFNMVSKNHLIDLVIIEKQVNQNVIAMSLMYSIYTKALEYVHPDYIFIFDPKLKFNAIHESYITKNKLHKKQSIKNALNFITETHSSLVKPFSLFKKQDDIADSLNQALVYLAYKNISIETLSDLRKLYGLNQGKDTFGETCEESD